MCPVAGSWDGLKLFEIALAASQLHHYSILVLASWGPGEIVVDLMRLALVHF